MKRLIGCIIIFVSMGGYIFYASGHVILSSGIDTVKSQKVDQPEHTVDPKAVQKQKKYFGTAQEEAVTFYVQQNAHTNNTIARNGVLVRKPDARATVLICHGFMCDKDDIRFLRSIFADYNTLTFDFRAHGENIEGQCCTFGRDEAYDVIGAVKFIKSQPDLKDKPVIAYGFSMGAAASIIAQSMDNSLFTAAIWDCPFDSTENIIGRGIENLKITMFGHDFAIPCRSFLHKYAYNPYVQSLLKVALKAVAKMDATQVNTCIAPVNPAQAIKHVAIPCLIIGCRNDEKAPIEAVRSVYDGAAGYKRLWVTNGRRHFDSFFYNPEKYVYKVKQFIEKVLDDTLAHTQQQKITEDHN